MNFSLAKIAFGLVATTLLWGCMDGNGEPLRPVARNDTPIGGFFRTAATSSQDRFDYQSAAKYYQNLYNRDPGDVEALLGLVRNLRNVGLAGKSIALLEDTLPENLEVFAVRAELGKSLVASGRANDAIEVLTKMLEEVPDDWELLFALGIAYDLINDPENAERTYRAALEISPQNANIINNLSLSLALSGKIDDGIALLEDIVLSASSTPHIRQNLALLYAMKGDIAAARQLVEQDLSSDLVENNIKYYERYFARAGGAKPLEAVQVSRLEEPAAEALVPVVPKQTQAAMSAAAGEEDADAPQPDLAVFTPLDGIKIQLGVFQTLDRATAGLTEMRDNNVDLLSGLRFVIDEIEGIDAPVGFMVLARPLASQQVAADLCTKLHSRKKVCRLVLP
jgi:Flp pilus assembly protein TadD